MNRLFLTAFALGFGSLTLRAELDSSTVQCRKTATFFAPVDSPDHRKYAPDRDIDILHLALEIEPDFAQRTFQGKAIYRLKPRLNAVRELKLDAVELNISAVTSSEAIKAYQVTDEQVIITFGEAIPVGKETTLVFTYSAEPRQGLYFRTPEMGYKDGDTHLFTQGESVTTRNWFPSFDAPNRMFTSELTCRVPEGMTVISNGRLLSQERDAASGKTVFHWLQDKPHANYLITLVAGRFNKLEDKHRDVPLGFYTLPSQSGEAEGSFRVTRDVMEFFEAEIGVSYPWAKYDQVCVNDFMADGMENTTATTLTDRTLFSEASEELQGSEPLVAHELAHQWFGDLVTCKDWSHVWLNEGFATYYDCLYQGHKHGRDMMNYTLLKSARLILGVRDDTTPIVRRDFNGPDDMFGYLAYDKGGWVLHMLRSQLGDEMYRKVVKAFLERYRHANVVTENLRTVIEELTGQSFDRFFDQWVYHAHYPELDITYGWDEGTGLAKISIRQAQKLDANVLLFQVPLTVRFQGKFGTIDRVIEVKEKDEDFYIPLSAAPDLVRIDPQYTLLAKISFNPPASMLDAQLGCKDDMIGRVLAVEKLGARKDKESLRKLKRLLNEDPFFGVRLEASSGLRLMHTDEALEALLASTDQKDARVRQQVALDINGFYKDTAYASARGRLGTEKNPEILSVAIRGMAGYEKPEVRDTLLKYLRVESFRNRVANAAVAAIRLQDDPAYVTPLMRALSETSTNFGTIGLSQAFSALAYIARNDENKDAVRSFLAGYLDDKRVMLRLASINALGTLGDPKAVCLVEKFTTASKNNPERGAAEKVVGELRASRKPVDDFKNLRQEVLDLQKSNRELRQELDDLKKRFEAKPADEPSTSKSGTGTKKNKPLIAPSKKKA